MRRTQSLTGQRFGRWMVLGPAPDLPNETQSIWTCRCDCGAEKTVRYYSLLSGDTRSCGCYSREFHGNRRRTHALSNTPTYQTWVDMKRRCFLQQNKNFKHYGARGITVCDRWRESFSAFVADMGIRPDGMTLDRKNNDGDYEPDNCRWATMGEQQNNRRSNRLLTWNGETHNLRCWALRVGLSPSTLGQRLKYGWTLDECLTRPKPARWQKLDTTTAK